MIKNIFYSLVLLLSLFAFTAHNTSTYKCMIQMKNYTGEGAYISISLLNPNGDYEQTLYIHGDDDEWYHTITHWWNFYGKKRANIDAITGATISGGNRAISFLQIPTSNIDSGYSIRFETAVEDQEYFKEDIQFPLTSENLNRKIEGKGFIRYIRLIAQ